MYKYISIFLAIILIGCNKNTETKENDMNNTSNNTSCSDFQTQICQNVQKVIY